MQLLSIECGFPGNVFPTCIPHGIDFGTIRLISVQILVIVAVTSGPKCFDWIYGTSCIFSTRTASYNVNKSVVNSFFITIMAYRLIPNHCLNKFQFPCKLLKQCDPCCFGIVVFLESKFFIKDFSHQLFFGFGLFWSIIKPVGTTSTYEQNGIYFLVPWSKQLFVHCLPFISHSIIARLVKRLSNLSYMP